MKEIIYPGSEKLMRAIIDALPFFGDLNSQEKAPLVGTDTRLLGYDIGEFLIQEGAKDRSLFFLLSGCASVVKEGASFPLASLQPGDFFGEVAFLTVRVRTTNVIVHTQSITNTAEPEFLLPEKIRRAVASQGEVTALVLRLDPEVVPKLAVSARIKIKDQVIARLSDRVESMLDKVEVLTGVLPELCVDPDLEELLHQGKGENLGVEETKDRIIHHLVEFVEELNQKLIGLV